jgi:hypothetical protein
MEAHEGKHAAYGTRDVEIKKKEGNHFVMLKAQKPCWKLLRLAEYFL